MSAATHTIAADTARSPAQTLPGLLCAARPSFDSTALADLVRSIASQPGLRDRLEDYATADRTAALIVSETR